MMRALILPVLLLATSHAAAQSGELRSFGDWVVGCDNQLDCTAIGLSPDLASTFAYLKVARGSGAESGPIVSVTILDEIGDGGPIELDVEGGTLPVTSLDAPAGDSSFVSAELGAVDHGAFIDTLLPGETLAVTLGEETVPVSLAGMSAALRFMDDVQGRDGGVTALVAKGEAGADAVTMTPLPETVAALALSEVAEPGERPDGVAKPEEHCFNAADDMVLEAEDGARLWAVCSSAGAYNLSYDFWIATDGEARPADLGALGAGFGEASTGSTLVNPMLSEDGRTILAFARGRGLGDCGSVTSWAFDGQAMRLVDHAMMPECRGVMPQDWPVLYRAEIE